MAQLRLDATHAVTRVLVVDDEATIRELVADALREEGYVIDTAANGLEALRAVARHRPSAIVLDVMMPQLDGHGFLERLRQMPGCDEIPVLVVTAAYAAQATARQLGAHAWLGKPFELEALVSLVDELIGQPVAH